MSRQTRRDRRQLDASQRRRAANERIGHETAWLYYWGPKVRTVAPVAAAAVGGWWVWTHVSHARIGAVLAGLGVLLLVAYSAWIARNGLHARMMAVARGREINRAMWHLIGAGGVCLVAAGLMLLRASL